MSLSLQLSEILLYDAMQDLSNLDHSIAALCVRTLECAITSVQ